jgi:hypothetical protein
MANLWEIPIDQALKLKYEVGREKYRLSEDEEFAGNPLIEAHSEILDLLNYFKEARVRRMFPDTGTARAYEGDLRRLLRYVRVCIKEWEAM